MPFTSGAIALRFNALYRCSNLLTVPRMKYISRLLAALLISMLTSLVQGGGFNDDFSDPKLEIQQAFRGDWIFEDKVASCVSDPELYIEFLNHGPILRWPCEITDGSLEFEFKPKGCERVVITYNGDGHIVRISLKDDGGSSVFGWIGKSSKENKSQSIAKKGVPSLASIDGQWIKVKLAIKGDSGRIRIGDYSASIQHGSLAREKGEFTFSFASGECAVRNVSVR